MKGILISCSLLGLVVFSSCSKSNSGFGFIDLTDPMVSARTDYSNYRLTVEQIDSIGMLDNQYLAAFFENLILDSADIESISNYNDYVIEYELEVPGISGTTYDDLRDSVLSKVLAERANPSSIAQELSLEAAYLDSIVDAANTYNDIKSVSLARMAAIRADTNLSSLEHNSFLAMYSVLMYSSYYWLDTIDGGSGNGRVVVLDLQDQYPNCMAIPWIYQKQWLKEKAKKDALGAAIGMAEWCGVAAWASAGSVWGFVGSAVWGAVKDSTFN